MTYSDTVVTVDNGPSFDRSVRGHQHAVGERASIPAATQAALWTLSNNNCYFPGCPVPVVVEVHPGVYRKNAMIAHVYGVKPRAPRYRGELDPQIRDSFANLVLLCLAHHGEIDDPATGEKQYPPETLHEWKAKHEGADARLLETLGPITEGKLAELLTVVFNPPLQRLDKLTQELERTGTLNASMVAELRIIVDMLIKNASNVDARAAAQLAFAAETLGTADFHRSASSLAYAAETLPAVAREIGRYARNL